MASGLSKHQLTQYHLDGVIFPVEVFSSDQATDFRVAVETIASQSTEGTLKRLDGLHLFFDWAYRLVSDERLLDAVESVLGRDLLIDGTLVLYKPPQASTYVSWHQDSVYSGWHLTPSVSAWIALTASHQRNGCMRVIPGSHLLGPLNHANARDDSNLLFRGERVEVVDESRAQDVVLRPGEMSLHHSNLVHGSNPNTSDEARIGFIVRFVTNEMARRERPVMRVRGDADCSHLILAEPPASVDFHEALSTWLRNSL